MWRCFFWWVAASTVLLITGCASPTIVTPVAAQATPTSAPLTHFTVSGRFSAKNGKEQASGQFRFSQTASQRALSIFSPLGTPLAEISADETGAAIALANGETQRASSVAELLRNVIELPVTDAQLSLWLQGRPSMMAAPNSKAWEFDTVGRIARFTEAGWDVSVTDRFAANDANGNYADAPRRMRWSRSGDTETEVRWIVDEWKTP